MSVPESAPRANGTNTLPAGPRAAGQRVIQLCTRCATESDFTKAFAKFVDQTSVVIPGAGHLPLETPARFVILLADNRVVFEGTGKVIELFGLASEPAKRKGVRLKLLETDSKSRDMHAALMQARQAMLAAAKLAPKPLQPAVPPPPAALPAAPGPAPAAAAPPASPAPPPASIPSLLRTAPPPRPPLAAPGPVRPAVPAGPPARPAAAPPIPAPIAVRPAAAPPIPAPIAVRPPAPIAAPTAPIHPPIPPEPSVPTMVAAPVPVLIPAEPSIPTTVAPPMQSLIPAEPSTPTAEAEPIHPPVAAETPAPSQTPPPSLHQPGAAGSREERAPGSKYKLPANPLAELDDDALGDFVECTLFEDNYSEPVPTGSNQPLPELVQPRPAFRRERRVSQLARRWAPALISGLVSLAVGYFIWGTRTRGASEVPPARVEAAREPEAVSAPAPSPPAPAPSAPAARATTAPTPAVVAPAPPVPVAAPLAKAPAEPSPGRGASTSAAAPAPAAKVEAAPGETADRCKATIALHPNGAEVFWGGRLIGTSPLVEAPVPCGPANVTLAHPRYKPIELDLVAQPGTTLTVSERLSRPTALLKLTSTPAQAVFQLNAARLGPAPTKTTVMRFEKLSITAKLPGYKIWSRTMYVKSPVEEINAHLEPIAQPKSGPKRAGFNAAAAAGPGAAQAARAAPAARPK